jgi:hypothetical protein
MSFINQLNRLQVECDICGNKLQRAEFIDHVDVCNFDCLRNCNKVINRKLFEKHDNECSNKIIPCPIGSNINIKRKEIEIHDNICCAKMIKCSAHDIGCNIMMKREDLGNHIKSCNWVMLRPILSSMFDKINTLEIKIS